MDGDEGTRMVRLLALCAVLFACGKAPEKEPLEDASLSVAERYEAAVERLLTSHLENGWVVTRTPSGKPEHVGDSLLWTGVLLSALPCERGDEVEAQLVDMVKRHAGALVRYEPLGEYQGGREISADGALGLYRGIAHRAAVCGRAGVWKEALQQHFAFVDGHQGQLNPDSEANLGLFRGVLGVVADRVGDIGDSGPSDSDLRAVVGAVTAWAFAVKATHSACFRIHLGYLAFRTLETLKVPVSRTDRDRFCFATRGTDIPIVDNWCGRPGLKDWVDSYVENQFEYRQQRCSWESPDGDGDETPGLDFLVGVTEAYAL